MLEDVFMDIRFCNILANVAHVHRIRAQFWLGPIVSICTVPKVSILLISWGICASEWILEKKYITSGSIQCTCVVHLMRGATYFCNRLC